MVVHREHGLLVHIDAMPSETITHDDEVVVTIVGTVCDQPEGLPGLRQWKYTSRREKTKSLVLLCRALEDGSLSLHSQACLSTVRGLRTEGQRFLDAMPASHGEWEPSGRVFRVEGHRVNRPVALALAGYGFAMVLIGLRAAIWAQRIGEQRVTLIPDRIPFNNEAGMALLRAMSFSPAYLALWQQTREKFDVDFQIGNLGAWRMPGDSEDRPVDREPLSVLADWVAQSFHAAINVEQWLDEAPTRSERFRRLTASPAIYLLERDPRAAVGLDGVEYAAIEALSPATDNPDGQPIS